MNEYEITISPAKRMSKKQIYNYVKKHEGLNRSGIYNKLKPKVSQKRLDITLTELVDEDKLTIKRMNSEKGCPTLFYIKRRKKHERQYTGPY